MKNQSWRVVLVGLLAFALLNVAVPQTAARESSPMLRLLHASPGAPALDVYINNQKVATATQFSEVTPYITVPGGSYHLRVVAAGAAVESPKFIDTSIVLKDGEAYTIVAADRFKQMTSLVLPDDPGATRDNQAHVRLVHVSPDAPAVADVAVAGGPVVARNLAFKGVTGYLTVAPGAYRFEVRPAGSPQALATTSEMTVEANRTYSAYVIGLLGDNSFRAILVTDSASTGGMSTPPATGGGGMAATASRSLAGAVALTLLLLAATLIYGRRHTASNHGR